MIALLDTTDKQPEFWRGLMGGVTLRRIDVLHARCAHITLASAQNSGSMDRRFKAAERALRRAGTGAVCFAEGFPYAEHFTSRGFAQAGETELYDAVADKAAVYLAREGSAAYLYAPRPSDMAMRTLAVLCGRCRLVMADIPGGGDSCAFAFESLRRSLGVSIVESPPAHMLFDAETAFIFGVPRFEAALPSSCVVYAPEPAALLTVGAGRYVSALEVALPEDKERLLPDGFPRAPLIAEAMRSLTLSRNTPSLRGITVSDA